MAWCTRMRLAFFKTTIILSSMTMRTRHLRRRWSCKNCEKNVEKDIQITKMEKYQRTSLIMKHSYQHCVYWCSLKQRSRLKDRHRSSAEPSHIEQGPKDRLQGRLPTDIQFEISFRTFDWFVEVFAINLKFADLSGPIRMCSAAFGRFWQNKKTKFNIWY